MTEPDYRAVWEEADQKAGAGVRGKEHAEADMVVARSCAEGDER